MSWLPHPSTWGKKNRKPPSTIMTVSEGTVELLKSMGVDLKEDGSAPLYIHSKVVPTPFPERKASRLLDLDFKYGKEDKKE